LLWHIKLSSKTNRIISEQNFSKSSVVFGVNQLTKAVEYGETCIILACNDGETSELRFLNQYLYQLCSYNDAEFVEIPKPDYNELASLLDLQSACLGFKRSELVEPLLDIIMQR